MCYKFQVDEKGARRNIVIRRVTLPQSPNEHGLKQILDYPSIYFFPTLILLAEPDEHLKGVKGTTIAKQELLVKWQI